MGGSKTEIHQPTPPPAPSTADAVRAFTQEQPKLFDLQLQQAPKEVQQQLELLQQYGAPLGQATRDAQRAINPELTNLQDSLAGQALEGSQAGLSPDEIELYKDQFKSLVGNQVNSGIGADFIGQNLLGQQLERKDYFRNLGLSLGGQQPIAQPGNPQYNNLAGSLGANNVLGANAQNYGSQLGFSKPFATQSSGFGGMMGNILGGAGGLFTGIGNL